MAASIGLNTRYQGITEHLVRAMALEQVASIAAQTLITTATLNAVYRISIDVFVTTTDAGAATVLGTVAFTDKAAATTLATATAAFSGANRARATVTFTAAAATITYTTTVAGAIGTGKYGVTVVVERLE